MRVVSVALARGVFAERHQLILGRACLAFRASVRVLSTPLRMKA
jgi:hypothetical protein